MPSTHGSSTSYILRKRAATFTPPAKSSITPPQRKALRLLLLKAKIPCHTQPALPMVDTPVSDAELIKQAKQWVEALPFLPIATPIQFAKIRTMYELLV